MTTSQRWTPVDDPAGGPATTEADWDEQAVNRRVRVALVTGAILFALVLALPVLSSFTSVLDGVVGGIGVAYIVGFAEFVLALVVAVVYTRWVDRAEAGRTGRNGGRR